MSPSEQSRSKIFAARPSAQIYGSILRGLVDQRMGAMQAELVAQPGMQFLKKALGTTDADMAEQLMKDPRLHAAAVALYLDIQYYERHGFTGPEIEALGKAETPRA